MAALTKSGRGVLRKRLSVLLNIALLVVVVATFLSGFVGAALDLNRFAYHKYTAYLAILLALGHVVLHWRALVGQVRRWLTRNPVPPPKPAHAGPQAQRMSRRSLLMPGLAAVAGVGLGRWLPWPGAAPALQQGDDLGQTYHEWSKPTYLGLLTKSVRIAPQPPLYKTYTAAEHIDLPDVAPPLEMPLGEAVTRRRSVREYGSRPLELGALSQLLHLSAGITDRLDPSWPFRAAPSSGALYPIEVYPVLFDVSGTAPGIYHYDVQHHALDRLRSGDLRREAFAAALSQEMVLNAAAMLVFTGLFSRVQWRYVDRSYRYMLLEAGHVGQNAYLAATALGLGACGIGAFLDDDVNQLVGVDGRDEAALYLMAIGPRP
jgi:SagB-type dehydrogenase family enzyme